ncbi:hypothetical protein [Pandoraea sp.]|uniref:hypothetical protein n=1 Tax=Pandoraea sp. TaxID=1883445 RepID=UPI0035AED392
MTTPPVSPQASADPTPTLGVSASPEALQSDISNPAQQTRVDDEPMRLITSFNDVFVVVASALLTFGTVWLTRALPPWVSALLYAAVVWGLSEIFVRRRRMALPALCYSFGFIAAFASIGFISIQGVHGLSDTTQIPAEAHGLALGAQIFFSLIASYIGIGIGTVMYWRRFRVPVTIAMGIGGAVCLTWLFVVIVGENLIGAMSVVSIVGGLAIFVWALRWDAADTQRTTFRSDVAFWLHLLAACMVTHPIFWMLMPAHPVAAIAVFVLLTGISLAIDRRALMMSSLLYVIVAILNLLVTSQDTHALAVVAVAVGSTLLLLSAFWQPARARVLKQLPASWRARLPH